MSIHPLRARSAALLLTVAAATACHTSPPPAEVAQATSFHGARVTVSLADGRSADGELLAASDTALVLLVNGRVASVRNAALLKVDIPEFGTFDYGPNVGDSAKHAERIRTVARFPFGIAPPAMTALLARTSQTEPDDLAAVRQP